MRGVWTHTFGEVTPDLRMVFAGRAFNVIDVTRDRNELGLGTGLNAVIGESTTARIDCLRSSVWTRITTPSQAACRSGSRANSRCPLWSRPQDQ